MLLTENEAISHIISNQDRFSIYTGAGTSSVAGVKTTTQICDEIKADLLKKGVFSPKDIDSELKWNDRNLKYYTCISKAYGNEAARIDYFKRILKGIRPSFFHYGVSLLISNNILRNIAYTTNFDKLIELAFSNIGHYECQAIRMEEEAQYISLNDENKSYLVKLHGDYDTNNILNTRSETKQIKNIILNTMESNLKDSGLLVLGTAGYEKSVNTLFDKLLNKDNLKNGVLKYGLLWGVYMGQVKPGKLTPLLSRQLLKEKIESDTVSSEITSAIEEAFKTNSMITFFPVWDASEFIFNLIKASNNKFLARTSELYLDHDMRVKNILVKSGVSAPGIKKHLQNLKDRKQKFELSKKTISKKTYDAFNIHNKKNNYEINIYYGNIASRSFLHFDKNPELKKVVVSPDDTFLSAGGGVSYDLLNKGGKSKILNELYKLYPVNQNDIAITSGFELPVNYIFHAAAIKIDKNANYNITPHSLKDTIKNILLRFNNLDCNLLSLPLIGSGLGSLTATDSFNIIWGELVNLPTYKDKKIFNIVISEEKRLQRDLIRKACAKLDPLSFITTEI